MASVSIRKRIKSDGTPRDSCFIRVKEKGKALYSESKTFTKKTTVTQWGKRLVLELEKKGHKNKGINITLDSLINKYRNAPHNQLGEQKITSYV